MTQPNAPIPPHLAAASEKAHAHAAQMQKDDALARAKGAQPDQVEARKRVVALFREMHIPELKPDAPVLASIDYSRPITPLNGRTVDVNNPKGGFLGLGRKPAYLVSTRFPPQKPEEPIYILEYYPHTS